MPGIFEIKKTTDDKFVFNLKAANGEVVLTSQRYAQKDSARQGIESVRRNGADAGRFDRRGANDASPYFVLAASNGEVIGTSQMYRSKDALERGIEAVRACAPSATIEDRA